MTKYTIIEDKDLDKFLQKVNAALENGYQCVGGVAVSATFFYVQAMIKTE